MSTDDPIGFSGNPVEGYLTMDNELSLALVLYFGII